METIREPFNAFPLVASDEPLNSDQFYKWLTDSEEFKTDVNQRYTRHNDFFVALDNYLSGYGYSKEKHTLSESAIKTLEYVFDVYQRFFCPIKPTSFNNLLRPTDKTGYWVQNKSVEQHYKPTALLRHALKEIGLVYDLEPQNYYFQVSGGYLFIKYQSILGSRRLCLLKGDADAQL